jgi:hypothetical protein
MASNVKYAAALKNTRLDAITTRAGTSALLRIYDGSQPATADTAVSTQTLLAELTCNASAFASAASGGVLTASAITTDSSANATGTATWFRLVASNGTTVVCDGTVGTSGSDLNLSTTSIVSGSPVAVSSFVITHGN